MSKELLFLMYNTPDENVSVNAVIKDETIWLTQKAMAGLFDCSVDNISLHIKNIFATGELNEISTVEDFSVVQTEGNRQVNRKQKFYNLDAIISVGYRVNSKENMNLKTWKNAPDGRILKSDVTTAKNYLDDKQIRRLERIVTSFFDYIEDLIEEENVFTMQEFTKSVNAFLTFREFQILNNKGTVSKKKAEQKAFAEYDKFNKIQKINSDFEKQIKKIVKGGQCR